MPGLHVIVILNNTTIVTRKNHINYKNIGFLKDYTALLYLCFLLSGPSLKC